LLVRILLVQGQVDEALDLLARLQTAMEAGERRGLLIEALVLQAKGLSRQSKVTLALSPLGKALDLAEPEGYVRVFLDEGKLMQLLLGQWLANTSTGPERDYAFHLLSSFDQEAYGITDAPGKTLRTGNSSGSLKQALIEPLSQRELEVLSLMALGRTNHEIAQLLVVAPGTVKAHAARIYRKLDAANRTEAVARARQLHIVPL
jgi:LuxR family transcriptional regulator, maltose regulon positive regulatory protein